MWNSELDEAQAEIKIVGRNINNLRYADDIMAETLMAESERKELKIWLKTQNSKNEEHGIWFPITSWQIDGKKNGNSKRVIFLGYKINADGDCSYEIKRCLLLARKSVT